MCRDVMKSSPKCGHRRDRSSIRAGVSHAECKCQKLGDTVAPSAVRCGGNASDKLLPSREIVFQAGILSEGF